MDRISLILLIGTATVTTIMVAASLYIGWRLDRVARLICAIPRRMSKGSAFVLLMLLSLVVIVLMLRRFQEEKQKARELVWNGHKLTPELDALDLYGKKAIREKRAARAESRYSARHGSGLGIPRTPPNWN